jgi:branched-chain amino acid transport system permease protein
VTIENLLPFGLQIGVNAIALAATLLVVALGLMLVLGALDIPHFAHGKVLMISGYAAVLASRAEAPLWLVLALAVITGAGVSVAMYLVAYRPLAGREMPMMLAAFAMVLILQNIANMLAGPQPYAVRLPTWLTGSISVGPAFISRLEVAIATTGFAAVLILWWLLNRTQWGVQIRALGESRRVVGLLGVPVGRVAVSAFAVAGALAGLAAVCWGAMYGISPSNDLRPLLIGFVAIVSVGGHLTRAGLLCLAFAIVISVIGGLGYAGWQDSITFSILLLFLVLYPSRQFR